MRYIKFIISLVICVFFLFYSFKGVNIHSMYEAFLESNKFYSFIGIITVVLMYIIRCLRWRFLLMPIKKTEFKNVYSATLIGFFLLYIIPARAGEFVRAYVVGKREKISKLSCFSTLVVERVLDALTSLSIFAICLLIYPEDLTYKGQSIKSAAVYLLSAFGAVLIILIIMTIIPNIVINLCSKLFKILPEKLNTKLLDFVKSFIHGLEIFRNFKILTISVLLSFLLWGIIALIHYFCLLSFGIDHEFYIIFILLGIFVVSVMFPTPGFLGPYQLLGKWAIINLYGQEPSKALSIVWVIWLVSFIPTTILGFIEFNKEHLNIKNINELEKK